MKTQFAETGSRESESPMRAIGRFPELLAGVRTILLISADKQLHQNLRALANTLGLMVVRAERAVGIVFILQATRPVAVLLDLDLPNQAAWETAELLLNEPGCPAVILLTARTAQFDMWTAMRAGSLVSKSEPPGRLLEIVEKALELPEVNRTERNAIQQVLIRRLRPSEWAESATPSYRFWGINE